MIHERQNFGYSKNRQRYYHRKVFYGRAKRQLVSNLLN